jgi:hypothetical protein
MSVPVSIAQLAGTCIVICRGQGSNPGHPTYSPWKGWILAARLPDQKKKKKELVSFNYLKGEIEKLMQIINKFNGTTNFFNSCELDYKLLYIDAEVVLCCTDESANVRIKKVCPVHICMVDENPLAFFRSQRG